MKRITIIFLTSVSLSASFNAGCGVKGKPQPPDEPPVLSRGEPNYSKAAKSIRTEKKKKPLTDDWNDSEDFKEEE